MMWATSSFLLGSPPCHRRKIDFLEVRMLDEVIDVVAAIDEAAFLARR